MQDSRAWHMGFGFGVHRVFRLSPMFGGGGGVAKVWCNYRGSENSVGP